MHLQPRPVYYFRNNSVLATKVDSPLNISSSGACFGVWNTMISTSLSRATRSLEPTTLEPHEHLPSNIAVGQ
ncbi:hypothetical protein L873DRAFT_1811740 [Choiromyces venosus 120613-1]|uniref:Uncharacterized protein n=1 Tax=Choiromyces venosus 120613-1 TaxID=1336337 RepID=A0A3N4JCX0_9PEZI|nr:hypothetical protein L873DRAFT_1811740 [Choiromyces venosus 120613-1]